MNIGMNVFETMGIDPHNYLAINVATTGVKSPVGILEIAGIFGDGKQEFRSFIMPEGMVISSDLNYEFTGIPRHQYDKDVITQEDFVDEMVPYLRERYPEIVIVNNEWWFNKVSKDRANSGLAPFFANIKKLPLFDVLAYENARVNCDYTVFDNTFEFYWEMHNHIKKISKQAPKTRKVTVLDSYESRGYTHIDDYKTTVAQDNATMLSAIWENILENNEAQELYK